MHPIQYSLTSGELSPRLEGRVDFAKYHSGLKTAEHVLLLPHGGATRRPGTRYLGPAKAAATRARLVPFVFSETQAYMLEFAHFSLRVWQHGALVEAAPGVPVEVPTVYGETNLPGLQWVQSADVLFVTHPGQHPYQIERHSQTVWRVRPVPFDPAPSVEFGQRTTATLTPSATSGAVSLTAAAAQFELSDVGREVLVTAGPSVGAQAIISAYVSQTEVLALVGFPFADLDPLAAGAWYLSRSPQTTLSINSQEHATATTLTPSAVSGVDITLTAAANAFTPDDVGREVVVTGGASAGARAQLTGYTNATEVKASTTIPFADLDPIGAGAWYLSRADSPPVGAAMTLFLGGGGGWRAGDVGKTVHVNGGAILLTALSSARLAVGRLVSEVATTTTSPTGAWTLEEPAWSPANGYPRALAFHHDRLWFGGSAQAPNALWASKVGDYTNFATGTQDDDALDLRLNSRRQNAVQWLEATDELLAGTLGEEWLISGGDEPLTPANVRARSQTIYGSAHRQPLRVGSVLLFLQAAGRKLRELTYQFERDGYVAPDLTLLAEHLTAGGLVDLAYQQEPDSVVWAVRADGVLLSLTYQRDQDVVGWCRHPPRPGDAVESVATIPHPDGDRDQVWLLMRRTIDGATVRYVEVLEDGADLFDWPALQTDGALSYQGPPATTISGLAHLEGATVAIVGDGAVYPSQVVSGGQITLDPAASVVEVGLPYTSVLETLRPEVPTAAGTAQGRLKRWSDVVVRLESSVGLRLNGEQLPFRSSAMPMDRGVEPFSGDYRVDELGWHRDGRLLIEQPQPLPMTVLMLSGTLSVPD